MKKVIQIKSGKKTFYSSPDIWGTDKTEDIRKAKDYLDNDDSDFLVRVLKKEHGSNSVEVVYINAERLTTDKGVLILDRIEKGQTFISRVREKAQDVADDKRSYVYDVFLKGKFWGFAVPN